MHRLDTFPNKELLQQYRNVFGSKEGPAVLSHMLFELGFFEDMPNMSAEDAALKNYGARLLNILGGGDVVFEAKEIFFRRVMSQPLKDEKKSE